MADGKIQTIIPRLCRQSPGQESQDSQSPHTQNMRVLKKVIAALQAAQLLPTD